MSYKMEVTSSNSFSFLLCEHIKKKKIDNGRSIFASTIFLIISEKFDVGTVTGSPKSCWANPTLCALEEDRKTF